MKEECESCISTKEQIYWTNFHTMHFCQFLSRDFHSRLMIHRKFADNKKLELPEKLEIRGPSNATWEVALETSDDKLYFGDGWEEFVKDHTLQQNDILIFKYTANSQFDVLILDSRSLCEKEDSYFVRKCGQSNTRPENGCHAKLLQREKSIPIIQDGTDKDLEPTPKKKPRKEENAILADHDNNKGIQVQEAVVELGSVKRRLGNGRNSGSVVTCASNRRSITEVEKRAVLRKACEELSDDGFIVVMRATHVYKKFFMNVPAEWLTKHVIQSKQDMILRTKERSWKAKIILNSRGLGGFSSGWREFAVDNSLEEFDVCLFKLDSSKHEPPLTLDVTIFRVVPLKHRNSSKSLS